MKLEQIIQRLKGKAEVKLVEFISDKGPNSCNACRAYHGKVYQLDEPSKPELPIHPNCRCKYVLKNAPSVDVSQEVEEEKIFRNITSDNKLSYDDARKIATQITKARNKNAIIKEQKLFLLFNGEQLISSDGKLVLQAVSGVPVSHKTFFSRGPIFGTVQQTAYKIFNYSIERQSKENKGGLPQGLYTIECKESGSLLNGNVKKHGLGQRGWGNYHWRLIPDKDTNMRGRKPFSFTIHGGSEAQSAGCIDLTSQDIDFRNYLRSTGLKKIHVFVQYDKENVAIKEEKIISMPWESFRH